MNVRANAHSWAPAIIIFVAFFAGILLQAQISHAQGDANAAAGANAECAAKCAADKVQAEAAKNPALNCIGLGGAKPESCTYSGAGGSVAGQCLVGMVCQAQTANGKGVDSGLSQLGQMLGQLLSKLGQSSGGGGGGGSGSSPTTGTTGCTNSYYYTSDTSRVGVDPCALYQPATSCTDPNASNYGAQTACTYSSTTLGSSSAQNLLNSLTGSSGTGSTATNDVLNASPRSGSAPLMVSFTATPLSTDTGPFSVDPGDGSGAQAISCGVASGPGCTYQLNYTYTTAGTYTANLLDANGFSLANTTVSITNPGSASGTGLSGLTQVFANVGGLSASSSQSGQSSPNFPGVLGNILFNQNGATIFAQTVNSANNSETSGFYGSGTMTSPQGAVGQMCQSRPWSSNFLADIIPPSFFDSLCQWGGFQVGHTNTQAQPAPQVKLTQQTQTTAKPKPTTAATNTAPVVAPQAVIWAVPSSVPLGARTSVYWNTQGVAQCNETSPDGSFNENSLSGAQATVPLTGATTYTISCLDPNGNPITNYVTVNISN